MLYIKENKGITITALVIMIIVIMLLAGITITQGSDLIKNTKVETYLTNMITRTDFKSKSICRRNKCRGLGCRR